MRTLSACNDPFANSLPCPPQVESISMLPQSLQQAAEGRSIEQREREYAEAKARIFNSSRESSLSKEEDSQGWVRSATSCQANPAGEAPVAFVLF